MKTVGEILATIDTRVKEHTDVIQEVDVELKSLSRVNGASSSSMIQAASKKLILKDKIMFHKAAIAVLNDLKESING